MKLVLTGFTVFVFSLGISLSLAQQQPRFPIDPQSRRAIGAKEKPAEELKSNLESANRPLVIDVRTREQFQKETLPGAINIPLEELEGHLKKMSKDTFIVFT